MRKSWRLNEVSINVVSLFSGGGGLDLGFIAEGYNIIWAIDNNKNAIGFCITNIRVQLCIGMKLPPVLSACLLKASGKSFMMTEQHIMYQFLLNSCYHMSIFDCNEMLTAQGLKPLGRQNRVS